MSTYETAFIYNNHSVMPPPGSVAAFLGVVDPGDGWIICNGIQRTDGSDGRYNTLLALGIGSGTNNSNYTPPNLQGAFLRSTGTDSTGNYVGPSLKATQAHATQTHNHSSSISIGGDPNHYHFFNTYNDDFNNSRQAEGKKAFSIGDSGGTVSWTSQIGYTGITIANNTLRQSAFLTSANETRPYNFGVNWIIKY
jgi:hypothetical protein